MRKKILIPIFASLFVFPLFVSAASGFPAPKELKDILCYMVFLALDFVPLIVVFALGAMIQGLIKYVSHGDDEEKRSEGRMLMIYGIVGLFFIVSVWGILKIFANSYSIPFGIPQFKQDSSSTKTCGSKPNSGSSQQSENCELGETDC